MRYGAPHVYIAQTRDAGLGVFAARDFAPGEVVEVCPVRVIPDGHPDEERLKATFLRDYLIWWTDEEEAFCFGYALLYNHADDPNLEREWLRSGPPAIVFRTVRPVWEGEELRIRYRCGPWWESRPAPRDR